MSNIAFRHIGLPEDIVIEECSELIHIICKAKRFGYNNFHPDDDNRIPNHTLIRREIQDVMDAIKEYEIILDRMDDYGY
jgi:hypothetical protein